MSIKKSTIRTYKFYTTERIELLREYIGISKRDFCNKIGYSETNYNNITSPARESKPPAELLECIAKSTIVNHTWLLTGEGPIIPPATGKIGRHGIHDLQSEKYINELFVEKNGEFGNPQKSLEEMRQYKNDLRDLAQGYKDERNKLKQKVIRLLGEAKKLKQKADQIKPKQNPDQE